MVGRVESRSLEAFSSVRGRNAISDPPPIGGNALRLGSSVNWPLMAVILLVKTDGELSAK